MKKIKTALIKKVLRFLEKKEVKLILPNVVKETRNLLKSNSFSEEEIKALSDRLTLIKAEFSTDEISNSISELLAFLED